MSAMTGRKLTVAEFLALPEGDITYELIDGQAIPKDKPMSPQRFHASVQKCLLWLLETWCQGRGDVYTELSLQLVRHDQVWIPVPDLTYVSFSQWPEQLTADGPCPAIPELVIEIISPSQSFGNMARKAEDYLNAGIPRVWIVDPHAKSITVYYPDAPSRTYIGATSIEDDFLPGLTVIPQVVFEQARIP